MKQDDLTISSDERRIGSRSGAWSEKGYIKRFGRRSSRDA